MAYIDTHTYADIRIVLSHVKNGTMPPVPAWMDLKDDHTRSMSEKKERITIDNTHIGI